MEYDISKLTSWEMLGPVAVPHSTIQSAVINKRRWNCILKAPDEEVTENYRLTTRIVAAVLLHKYGFRDEESTQLAIEAIDELNRQVVLVATSSITRNRPKISFSQPRYHSRGAPRFQTT